MKINQLFVLSTALSLAILFNEASAQSPQWTWAESISENGDDYGQNSTADANGNIYITGSYGSATLTFGSFTLTNDGTLSAFLVKYDPSGNVVWAVDPQVCSFNKAYAVTTDDAGNVYMVGGFLSDTIVFGAFTLINKGNFAQYVVKYDSGGNVVWAKTATGVSGGDDNAYAVTMDNSGFLYVTGEYKSDTIMFDGYMLINDGSFDAYVAKYDSDGTVIWAVSSTGTSGDFGRGIVTDNSGNVYITGHSGSGTLGFGAFSVTNNGAYDSYIAKFDNNGTPLWLKNIYGSSTENSKGIAIDNLGNPIVVGHSSSFTLTFGTTVLNNTGQTDMFLVKYDGSGNVVWGKTSSGSDYDYGWGIATDSNDDIYVVGHSKSDLNFGSNTTTNNGGHDVFVVKYNSGGVDQWVVSAGGSLDDRAYTITLDDQDNLFISGTYQSSSISFGTFNLTNSGGAYDYFVASMGSTTNTSVQAMLPEYEGAFMYPNPAQDFMTVDYDGNDEPIVEIRNLSGQVLYHSDLATNEKIDISTFRPGVYLVEVIGSETRMIEKLIKY